LYGFRYAKYLPSGDILKKIFSGVLKKSTMGICFTGSLQEHITVIHTIKRKILKCPNIFAYAILLIRSN
jgi:hypothetical protein